MEYHKMIEEPVMKPKINIGVIKFGTSEMLKLDSKESQEEEKKRLSSFMTPILYSPTKTVLLIEQK